MKDKGFSWIGKHYDFYFEWSDDRLYCSELVFKLYEELEIKLGEKKPLSSYDLSNPIVQYKLKERYGNNIPYDSEMISPGEIYNSEKLITVFSN